MNPALTPVPPVEPGLATPAPGRRLMSVDALRGFDMFWIVGGEELVHALYKAWPATPLRWLDLQMDHKAWSGVAFYDLIFPLFVFIAGVSIVFSVSRMIETKGRAGAIKRILIRSLIIYVLGLIVYGGLAKGVEHIRWLGVLQRIALCYLFAGIIFSLFRLKGIVVIFVLLLSGYWALASFVPVRNFNLEKKHLAELQLKPGGADTVAQFFSTSERVKGRFEDGLNLPQHFDYEFLPGRKWDGAYDPEGILSTLPAIGTCLFGVLAGLLLKEPTWPDRKKVLWLVVGGAGSVALGFLWGVQFPVIKKIWTSSYVLVAGGYACLFLAAFYQMIEVWNWRRWCIPFIWIGMNSITIYLIYNLVPLGELAQRVAGGPIEARLGHWGELLLALVVVGIVFLTVRFLYQRKIFLRF